MLFSLYNTKTDVFGAIFEASDRETAKRMFMELLNSPQPNQITQYIDEYILYEMGDFDKTTGAILVNPSPVNVVNGIQIVQEWKHRKALLDEIYSTPSPSGNEESTNSVDIPEFMKGEDVDECREQERNSSDNIVHIR